MYDVSCGNACDVSVIVCGCDFDDVCATGRSVREICGLLQFAKTVDVHKIEAPEAADDPLDLARRPTTCLRSSGYKLKKKKFSGSPVRDHTFVFCAH